MSTSILDFAATLADMASEQTSDSAWAEQFRTERESGLYVRTDDGKALTLGGFFAHAYGKVGKANGALEIIRGLVKAGVISAEQRDAVRFGRYGEGSTSRKAIHEAIVAFMASVKPAKRSRR